MIKYITPEPISVVNKKIEDPNFPPKDDLRFSFLEKEKNVINIQMCRYSIVPISAKELDWEITKDVDKWTLKW